MLCTPWLSSSPSTCKMQKNQLRKGDLVERLHVNKNLISMKPPQRVHSHFTCPILPVPEHEKAGRMTSTCAGEYGNSGPTGSGTQGSLARCKAACAHRERISLSSAHTAVNANLPCHPFFLASHCTAKPVVCFRFLKAASASPHPENTGRVGDMARIWLAG